MPKDNTETASSFNKRSGMGYAGMISDDMPNPSNRPEIGANAPDGQPWRKRFSSTEDAIKNAHAFAHNRA